MVFSHAPVARPRRVLFVAEDVTLAQVVRLAALAAGLDPARWEVHFACANHSELVFGGTSFRRWTVGSISPERVFRALDSGRRLYDERTLARYVEDDLRVLDEVRPDVVVGDFRLSLPVSAPLRGVPLLTLINGYWSPHAARERWPLPEHPIVRLLGVAMAEKYFPRALPAVFDHFAAPVNRLRKRHGLSRIGTLPEVLTFGDLTLFPDVAELVPVPRAPASNIHIGHVPWSPRVAHPAWWNELGGRPAIYLTLGSSGDVRVLSTVLSAVATLPVDVMLATAGRAPGIALPPNVRSADWLPGDEAARRSSVVVTNGGSSTGWQALREGTPVLGIPFNLDQYLATDAVVSAGAGLALRSGTVTVDAVRAALVRLLEEEAFREGARKIAAAMAAVDCHARFEEALGRATGVSAGTALR